MHPFVFPFWFLFLVILIFTLDHLPRTFCQGDAQYVACPVRFRCANYPDLEYPFWGGGRARHCGHPAFELDCRGDVPLITLQSRKYRVLGIDSRSLLITFAREDLWNNTCPSPFYNTDLDYRLFKHPSGDQNLTLSYGCNTVPGQRTPYKFDCTLNGTNSDSYFITQTALLASNPAWVNCSDTISVPINQTSAQSLTTTTASQEDLQEVLRAGFGLIWEANDTSCNECGRSGGRCGYNTSTSSFACYCIDRPYPSRCGETDPDPGKTGNNTGLKIGVASGVAVGIILLILALINYCRMNTAHSPSLFPQHASSHTLFPGRNLKEGLSALCTSFWSCSYFKKPQHASSHTQDIDTFIRQYGSSIPKRFRYSTLKKLTNSFKDQLGKGGYGNVYKGTLADGRVVAVKVLNSTKGNGEEFINEVASIGRTSHVNVVTLLGFCYEGKRRALIYEFMPNGSLEKFIYGTTPSLEGHLGWEKLYSIAIGIARGLEYLHRGCNTRILHFDIKPHNILLDENFRPKISDFGLAKMYNNDDSIISSLLQARGTIGYIAPEVTSRNFGQVSHKSDVYSYGMMILEMVGGRKNVNAGADHTSEIYYPRWLYKRIQSDDVLNLANEISAEENEIVRKMVIVGLWCIQIYPSQRPSISKVIEMLEGQTAALEIPPHPYLCSVPSSPSNSPKNLLTGPTSSA